MTQSPGFFRLIVLLFLLVCCGQGCEVQTENETVPVSASFGATLISGTFSEVCLEEGCLDSCTLLFTDFKGARFDRLSFRESRFLGGVFSHSIWNSSDLSAAGLSSVDFNATRFLETAWQGADLCEVSLSNTHLSDCSFNQTVLQEVDLSDAVLLSVDFSGSRFEGVNIAGAVFRECDFRRADLAGLTGWKEVRDLAGCRFDEVKNPPPGFLIFATEQRDGLTLVEAD